MSDVIAGLFKLFVVLVYLAVALGVPIAAIWVVAHFAAKYW